MGTRNLTLVRSKKKIKIAQYGQWDGYPSGAGVVIARFIQTKMNLAKFKQKVDQLQFKELSESAEDIPPEYSRDTGARILELVQESDIKYVENSESFLRDSLFCEFAYLLDLDEEIVIIYECSRKIAVIPFKDFKVEKMAEF
jgi:hypothetical protein